MKEDGFDRWAFVLVVFAILAVAIGSCAWNVSLYEECRQDGLAHWREAPPSPKKKNTRTSRASRWQQISMFEVSR